MSELSSVLANLPESQLNIMELIAKAIITKEEDEAPHVIVPLTMYDPNASDNIAVKVTFIAEIIEIEKE